MNREQKAVAIAEIAAQMDESHAIFAVDYRGISVAQAAELRAKLRDADATFKVVKNSLTERAADQVGAGGLKELLDGPTALTFVRGDVAVAAKAIADYARATQLLPFKGGLLDGGALDSDQIRSISRLPSRDVLYGQLVGVVASPVSGLVRTLAALVSGLAVALGQVREKKESGEIPAGEAPAAAAAPAPTDDAQPEDPAGDDAPETPVAEEQPETPAGEETAASDDAAETPAGEEQAETPAGEETAASEAPPETPAAEETAASDGGAAAETAESETTADDQADPAAEPAPADDNPADPVAAEQPQDADATQED